ncbi:MAG TPA: KH domain-containing protein, partial [Candidatus Saccharimonadales bacterium]|nr:KH domain-containing protein [Candidatus Saccharimonadales bacterium]
WDENSSAYITNALSPTKVTRVEIQGEEKKAKVIVPEDQLSIAIGKGGQNVRLASKLTGYELDIVAAEAATTTPAPAEKAEGKPAQAPKLKKKSELENSLLEAIEQHGEEQNQ